MCLCEGSCACKYPSDPLNYVFFDVTTTSDVCDEYDVCKDVCGRRGFTIDVVENLDCTFLLGGECTVELVYGENSEETNLLRTFRDNILSQTHEGRELIKLYYQWSPVIVRAMDEDEGFKEEVRELINNVIILLTEESE